MREKNWWTKSRLDDARLRASETAHNDKRPTCSTSVPAMAARAAASIDRQARPASRHATFASDRLTTPEAAYYVRLSARTLERLRVEGTGPQYIRAGNGKRARVFYLIADLDSWLEGKRYQSTAEYNS